MSGQVKRRLLLERGLSLATIQFAVSEKKDHANFSDIALDPTELQGVLQTQLFDEEEVKVVAQVRKISKKKNKAPKEELICITVSSKRGQGQRIRIQTVKHVHGSYIIKQTWKLEELHRIEFYDDRNDTGFTLYFDKACTWSAYNVSQRNEFLWKLWKLCENNLKNVPQTSIDMLELRLLSNDASDSRNTADSNMKDITHSYKELTPEEEKDLENLLNSCVSGATDIDELAERLTSNLQQFEVKQNIYEIIESELAVKDVLNRLTNASEQLDAVDKWLNYYNAQLRNMKQYIEHIITKNNSLEVVTRNQKVLLEELDKLLKKLQFDDAYKKVLQSGGLQVGPALENAIRSARVLDGVFNTYNAMKPGTQEMRAVKEKMDEYRKLKTDFCARLFHHVQELMSKISIELKNSTKDATWTNESHLSGFKQLLPYRELVHWYKKMEEKEKFDALVQPYPYFLKAIYKREIKDFFRLLESCIIKESKDQKILAFNPNVPVPSTPKGTPKPPEKMTIDKVYAYALGVIVPIIMAEQNFCCDFFQMTPQRTNDGEGSLEILLSELFEGLAEELADIVQTADKLAHFYPLTILVEMERYSTKYETASPFVIQVLSKSEMKVKLLFNEFIDEQITAIRDTQTSIKRCGILSYFYKFPAFVDNMEAAVLTMKGNVRTVIDPAYHKIILSMFGWVDQLGDQIQDPENKYKFIVRIENFHYFAREMTMRRIPCMAQYIQQAEEKYEKNLSAYIELVVKEKFQNLTSYFDGIDQLLLTLPAEEIQFQQSHSKQALAKYITKNTIAELEKKLQKLYKKFLKNFCPEEALAPEVWGALAKYLVTKYKHFEDLVSRCYKGQSLPFTSSELDKLIKTVKSQAKS